MKFRKGILVPHTARCSRFLAVLGLALGLLVAITPAGWAYPTLPDFSSAEAVRIADTIVSYQLPTGGWWGTNFIGEPWQPGRSRSAHTVEGVEVASFDNGATTSEMWFLARVYHATKEERFKEAFQRGLDFIFAAQYPSGGWPQQYPLRGGYWDFVTFNDHAMTRVMELLRDVAWRRSPVDFVDEEYRRRAGEAFERGIEYILRAQIEVDGRLTAWCAQHDPLTYEPRHGRPYEHPSISGAESVGIVRLLRSLPDPDERVRLAILSALEWFAEVELPTGEWARFYEIGTNWPIYSDRDGIVRYSIEEIGPERRSGYAWHGSWPRELLREADESGYLVWLYESLPEYTASRPPYPQIRLVRPEQAELASTRFAGRLEFDVEVWTADPADLGAVEIQLDGAALYSAEGRPPGPGEVSFDTTELRDGFHELTVSVESRALGRVFTRTFRFITQNGWRLVEEMRPPITSGWFGQVETGIDFLQASERSAGWSYATGDAPAFFGSASRMVRSGTGEESLTWFTPRLVSYSVTLYVSDPGEVELVKLLVAEGGQTWRELTPRIASEGPSPAGWIKVTLEGEEDDPDVTHFRLVVREGGRAGAPQLGPVVLEGIGERTGAT